MNFVDVHAHLTDERFKDDLKETVERADENNITKIICSAYDLQSSLQACELANQFPAIFATVGLHPENVYKEILDDNLEIFKDLVENKKVVAIGEIGLDYHYGKENIEKQKKVFVKQIEFANQAKKPIVVHSRDAMGDTIEVLKKNPVHKESLMHCFSGSIESAKILMNLGFSFSFGGVVTFSNAKNVVEVVKQLPMEKILLETDCPYMSPVPHRGKRNEPKNIVYVADMIAKIKGLRYEEVERITTQNAERLFDI